MKTIEEKAKAYDEVKNKLSRFIAQGVDPLITRADVQDFFPELAESDDERVKKRITLCLEECVHSDVIRDYEKDECIAWLKKQGQVKESHISQHENKMCKENDDSLTSEDEKIRKWIINEIKIKHHNLDEENVDFVDKAIAWLEKQGNMTERVIWKEIPKDKDGFFDDNSDLYDRLPIIITEEFKDFINLYYIDKENWHETLADLSRQRFVHYIEVRELKTK